MYATLLWATNGSAEADLALAEAKGLLEPGGRILAFHCDERFIGGRLGGAPLLADEIDRKAKIRAQVDELSADGVDAELLVETTHHATPRAIVRAADEAGADAIVCGTRGFGGLHRALAGSVSTELIHYSHVPVVVVPLAAHELVPETTPALNASFIG
jgi:nucleotide-binding universal stress UspA family protein